MDDVINFYMDDSGTRHPDHSPGKRPQHKNDWFALGGILVKDSDEPQARELHAAFCKRWGLDRALHSVEIRARKKSFLWLERRPKRDQDIFREELYQLMKAVPVTGLACVIDRPGYNARYLEKYGRQRWSLCKSAFTISVERAAKYARERGCRLRVLPERCNEKEDRVLKGYYEDLKVKGQPFDPNTSEKYRPLAPQEFKQTLLEFFTQRQRFPDGSVRRPVPVADVHGRLQSEGSPLPEAPGGWEADRVRPVRSRLANVGDQVLLLRSPRVRHP
jgi:uncharacterized protein DUF3800